MLSSNYLKPPLSKCFCLYLFLCLSQCFHCNHMDIWMQSALYIVLFCHELLFIFFYFLFNLNDTSYKLYRYTSISVRVSSNHIIYVLGGILKLIGSFRHHLIAFLFFVCYLFSTLKNICVRQWYLCPFFLIFLLIIHLKEKSYI